MGKVKITKEHLMLHCRRWGVMRIYDQYDHRDLDTIEAFTHDIAHLVTLGVEPSSILGLPTARGLSRIIDDYIEETLTTDALRDRNETRTCAVELIVLRRLDVPMPNVKKFLKDVGDMNIKTKYAREHLVKRVKAYQNRKDGRAEKEAELVLDYLRKPPEKYNHDY